MGFGHRGMDMARAVVAAGLTAALVYIGNGLTPHWPAMWLAPLPVLLFALASPGWQAGVVAFVAWLAGCANLWRYFEVLEMPHSAWFGACGMMAAVFTVGVLLMRWLARRGRLWSAWLALPAVWTSFEFARNFVWPHGSASSIAYSQLDFLQFLQTASLTGPWGMAFVLMLLPSGVALGIGCRKTKPAMRVMGAAVGVVAALLVFGAIRLALGQGGPIVKVGQMVSDSNGGASLEDAGEPTQRLFASYAEQARNLIGEGAQVVVMPEDMGIVLDSTVAAVDGIFQPVADQTGAVLVVGMTRRGAEGRHNEARIYEAGQAPRSYAKEHLLPPYETSHFAPGTQRTTFAAPGTGNGTWAVAICKDLDFTNPARAYGQGGVGLMLTPAWDFRVDGFWHGHIAVMRAVEDGFSLVRTARDGLLTVADDRGRVLAETGSSGVPFATLMATVPTGHNWTLFQLLGDWFGWCALGVLALVVWRATVR